MTDIYATIEATKAAALDTFATYEAAGETALLSKNDTALKTAMVAYEAAGRSYEAARSAYNAAIEAAKLFQVILKTDYCPGGPLSTKTKQADGTWHQIHGYGSGSNMVFKTLESAEKEARDMARPSSSPTRILDAWAEELSPELTARLIKSRFCALA